MTGQEPTNRIFQCRLAPTGMPRGCGCCLALFSCMRRSERLCCAIHHSIWVEACELEWRDSSRIKSWTHPLSCQLGTVAHPVNPNTPSSHTTRRNPVLGWRKHCCSSREHGFNFQHPNCSSQLSVSPRGSPTLFWALSNAQVMHKHTCRRKLPHT